MLLSVILLLLLILLVGHVQCFCQKKIGKLPQQGAATAATEDDSRGEGGAFVTPTFSGDAWLVDSGASSHMTPKGEYFASYKNF